MWLLNKDYIKNITESFNKLHTVLNYMDIEKIDTTYILTIITQTEVLKV